VDLPGHPGIRRAPARSLRDDSDLGDLPVPVAVSGLSRDDVARALARGAARADAMKAAGLIVAACLGLGGQTRLVGAEPYIEHKEPAHA
jgi:hypothetical protein